MRAHTEGLLNQLPTVAAGLCREAGIHSNHLMSSVCSFGFKDVEKSAPTRVHDALSEMMVFHQVEDVQVLYAETVVL